MGRAEIVIGVGVGFVGVGGAAVGLPWLVGAILIVAGLAIVIWGLRTLRQDGWLKTVQGTTTFDEVARTTAGDLS